MNYIIQMHQRMECIYQSFFVTSQFVTLYNDFINRARLLTQKLLNQGYVAPKLQTSLLKFYGHGPDIWLTGMTKPFQK